MGGRQSRPSRVKIGLKQFEEYAWGRRNIQPQNVAIISIVCDPGTSRGFEHFKELLKLLAKIKELDELALVNCGLTEVQVEQLVQHIAESPETKINRIDLSGNKISSKAAKTLRLTMIEGTVVQQHLRHCDLSSDSMLHLLQGIRQSDNKISQLDISGNRVYRSLYEANSDRLLNDTRVIWDRKIHEENKVIRTITTLLERLLREREAIVGFVVPIWNMILECWWG